MSLLQLLVSLVCVVAACGGSQKPAAVAASPADCDAAARASLSVVAWSSFPDGTLGRATSAVAAQCISDDWSIEATRCLITAETKNDRDGCVPLLTHAQREAAGRAIATAMPNGGLPDRHPDPHPEVAGTACTNTMPIAVAYKDSRTRPDTLAVPDLCAPVQEALERWPVPAPPVSGTIELLVRLHALDFGTSDRVAQVNCYVVISMRVAGDELFYTKGGAKVATQPSGTSEAANDCVSAVIIDVVNRHVGPAMRRLAAQP